MLFRLKLKADNKRKKRVMKIHSFFMPKKHFVIIIYKGGCK